MLIIEPLQYSAELHHEISSVEFACAERFR